MPLSARELSFAYAPQRRVLRAVSCDFPAGALTAIVGPNGAGKSTLLRLLLGLLEPDTGEVLLDSRPVRAVPRRECAARLIYIPQRSSIAFPYAVQAVVRFGAFASGGGGERAAREAMETAGVADRAPDPYGELSAGQQQRVNLARALAQVLASSPPGGRALLADEPVSAMDPAHAMHAMGVLRALAARGLAVAVVLHDLTLALRYADRVLALDAPGRAAAEGPTAQTLTPALLERLYGVPFLAVPDPGEARPAAIIPRPHAPANLQ